MRNEVSSFLLPSNRVNVHKNLFVLSKHKIPFVFARALCVKMASKLLQICHRI